MPDTWRSFYNHIRSAARGLGSWPVRHLGPRKDALPAEVARPVEQPESALYQAQKMEALGRLTGGVAHDFNNLLTVVLGNATALRMNAEARNDAQGIRRALLIERAAERGGRLAGQLLAFSGKQMLRPEIISVYKVISAMHEFLGQAAGETVRLALQSDRDLWNCHVDPGQLESAVLNLVLNARDAMPAGGNISISCRNRTLANETTGGSKQRQGDFVQTDVRDTGVGIPPDLLEKVFEPFFTTKAIGQGSGLGLAQVHGFAGQSGGWVELESTVGRGTTVSLFLPRVRGAGVFVPEVEKEPVPAGSNQIVLVVEPDADLRTTVCEILSQSGYHPLPAANASGALAYLVADEPIQLLLVEARLPGGVNGIDLARTASRLRPHIHTLITSGAIDNSIQEYSLADKRLQFLPKPYRVPDIVRVMGAIFKSETYSVEREGLLAEARITGSNARRDTTGIPGRDANEFPAQNSTLRRRSAIRLGVRPFVTTGSTEEKAFSMGLAEEVTRAFSPFNWISCVSPASIAAVAGGSGDGAPGWAELDLDFLLEGSLRRKGHEIRIVARLINMSGESAMVWERGFDGSMTDVLRLQDQIASETAAHVAPEVLVWKGQEVSSRPQVDPTAYDLMLRAIPAIYRLDETGFRGAGALLERALEMDPTNAACHSWLAHWYLLLIGQGWDTDMEHSIQRANELAQRAVELDPNDARGFAVAGHVRAFLRKEAPEALSLHERAIQLNPNFALAWCYSGLAHSYLGQHAEAVRRIEHAQRLSPHDPHGFFFDMALAMPYLLTEDYESAARAGRRAYDVHPGLSSTSKLLLSALGHLGAKQEAVVLRKTLLKLEPHFSVHDAISRSPMLLQGDRRRYADGLRLAGVRERAR